MYIYLMQLYLIKFNIFRQIKAILGNAFDQAFSRNACKFPFILQTNLRHVFYLPDMWVFMFKSRYFQTAEVTVANAGEIFQPCNLLSQILATPTPPQPQAFWAWQLSLLKASNCFKQRNEAFGHCSFQIRIQFTGIFAVKAH